MIDYKSGTKTNPLLLINADYIFLFLKQINRCAIHLTPGPNFLFTMEPIDNTPLSLVSIFPACGAFHVCTL